MEAGRASPPPSIRMPGDLVRHDHNAGTQTMWTEGCGSLGYTEITAKSPHDYHCCFPVVSNSKTWAPFPLPPKPDGLQMWWRCSPSSEEAPRSPSPHSFLELTCKALPAALRRCVLHPQEARGAQGLLIQPLKTSFFYLKGQ